MSHGSEELLTIRPSRFKFFLALPLVVGFAWVLRQVDGTVGGIPYFVFGLMPVLVYAVFLPGAIAYLFNPSPVLLATPEGVSFKLPLSRQLGPVPWADIEAFKERVQNESAGLMVRSLTVILRDPEATLGRLGTRPRSLVKVRDGDTVIELDSNRVGRKVAALAKALEVLRLRFVPT
jgi:hypothetical protein